MRTFYEDRERIKRRETNAPLISLAMSSIRDLLASKLSFSLFSEEENQITAVMLQHEKTKILCNVWCSVWGGCEPQQNQGCIQEAST
jgi:hypothetical protein